MTSPKHNSSRRNFLKTATAAGAASIVSAFRNSATASQTQAIVPTRPFGQTGIDVPVLSFGGSLDTSLNMLVLRQAVKWGVTYWDTAHGYMGGRSEKAMGKYLEKFPADRKKIFLVTKSHAWTLNGMSDDLDTSLKRLKTEYIDLYFKHSVRRPAELDDDIKSWAEKKKSEGKIRLFGFSTHSNMEECMLAAARLGWIDGIMMTYNFRLMQENAMRRAVDACARAGIGLTAMKTQGGGQVRTDTEAELKLAGRFLEKGFTDAQARLKAVWENRKIASICSEMPNMTILMSNVAAATDKKRLSAIDKNLLQRYARISRPNYCMGCDNVCEPMVDSGIPIGDIMRYLMYARSYGDRYRGSRKFQKIPPEIRRNIEWTHKRKNSHYISMIR
ncbi:Ferredoxin [Olavius algarvensis Delta 1 endosymbiont]|nr:Ferredoxin [Olavius algarvensis Delta 1 endosymbiont]